MQEHKKKRRMAEYYTDNAPIKTKKYFNSSERWSEKREIAKQVLDSVDFNIHEIRCSLEFDLSNLCQAKESESFECRLAQTLYSLGFGRHDLYKCKCEDLDELSDHEILIRAGYITP